MEFQSYYLPKDVREALELLEDGRGSNRIIAGGTDLVLDLKNEKHKVMGLIDISRIAELRHIDTQGDHIYIGASVTHADIARSELIRNKAGVLATACQWVGSPQIRNLGTLMGNCVTALPAADGAVALFVLDAEVEITTQNEVRWERIRDLYTGPGKSKIDSCRELAARIRFAMLPANSSSSFQRLARRKAVTLPTVNTAVVITIDPEQKRFVKTRIAVGPVAPTPYRADEAERLLKGAAISGDIIARAADLAAKDAHPRDSIRGSAEYKKDMVKVLVKRGLEESLQNLL